MKPKWQTWCLCFAFMLITSVVAAQNVVINVVAENTTDEIQEKTVQYVLPPELKPEDIIDTDVLELDYDVNEGGYFVKGNVKLEPGRSQTFRLTTRDVWKITDEEFEDIQKLINQGYSQITEGEDPKKVEQLRDQLLDELDYILEQQDKPQDNIERRIDMYRIHLEAADEIKQNALLVDYWRSEPGEFFEKRVIKYNIEVANTSDLPERTIKQKHFLPVEVKPEHIVNNEEFEVRFDEVRQQSFLFKEDNFVKGETKRYEIGIKDIWYVDQKDIDYLRRRSDYAYSYLKESRFVESAKILYDRIILGLVTIEDSQDVERVIEQHVGEYRNNSKRFDVAREDVEALEKLLAVFREELKKSKVENVLQKVRHLKGLSAVSKAIFKEKPKITVTWKVIGLVLAFVGIFTLIHFFVWFTRSARDRVEEEEEAKKEEAKERRQKREVEI